MLSKTSERMEAPALGKTTSTPSAASTSSSGASSSSDCSKTSWWRWVHCDARALTARRSNACASPPHAQRSGFGRLILSHLELRARQLGYTHLHLDTTAGQLAAQALYRRHGYRETGRERRGPFQLIFFEKSLTPHDGNK